MKFNGIKLFAYIIVLSISFTPIQAEDVVIDPGQNWDQQHRGGDAFHDESFSAELVIAAEAGEQVITVDTRRYFQESTAQNAVEDSIEIGDEIIGINNINDNNGAYDIELQEPLENDYEAGTQVIPEDGLLIQAIGQPESESPDSTDFDDMTYTYEVPASDWDQWQRMDKVYDDYSNEPQGLLEVLNTWKLSQELEAELDELDITYENTKGEDRTASPSLSNRGIEARDGDDIFISLHTNGVIEPGVEASYIASFYPHPTKFEVQWFENYDYTNFNGQDPINGIPTFDTGTTYYAQIEVDESELDANDNQDENYHLQPYAMRVRAQLDESGDLISGYEDHFIHPDHIENITTSDPLDTLADLHALEFEIPENNDLVGTRGTLITRGAHQTEYSQELAEELITELTSTTPNSTFSAPDPGSGSRAEHSHDNILGANSLTAFRNASDLGSDPDEPITTLVEYFFHDNPDHARWIIDGGSDDHWEDMAEQTADAIQDQFDNDRRINNADQGFNNIEEDEGNTHFPFRIEQNHRLEGQTINEATGYGIKYFNLTFDLQGTTNSWDVQSEDDGLYVIGLDTGTYDVSISYPNSRVSSSQVDFKDTTIEVPFPDDLPTKPSPPEEKVYEKDFELEPYAGVKGYVNDSWTGERIDGAKVTLKDTSGSVIKSYSPTGDGSKPAGYYIMHRFTQGTYDMKASKSEVGVDTKGSVSLPRNQVSEVDFTLKAEYPHFYGVVKRKRDGKPLGGASIDVSPQFSGGTTWSGNAIDDGAEKGRYRTGKLEGGDYKLSFSKTNYYDTHIVKTTLPDTGKRIDKKVQAKPVPLKLIVEGFNSGSPISDAHVEWSHMELSDSGTGMTGGSGNYQKSAVPWGTYEVTVSKSGYDTNTQLVTLPVGGNKTTTIRLKKLGDLTTFVHVWNGDTPIDGASVTIKNPNRPNHTQTTSSDGTTKFEKIPPRKWTIVASKSGHESNQSSAKVPPGGTASGTVALRPLATLDGSVTDARPSHGAVANATVKISRSDGFSRTTETGGGGGYSFNNIGIGKYSMNWSKQYYEPTSANEVKLKKSGTTQDTSMDHLAVVKVTVTDSTTGNPITGAKVVADHPDKGTTDPASEISDGTYKLPGVPSGDVTITVTDSTYGQASKSLTTSVNQTFNKSFYMSPEKGKVDGKILNKATGNGVYNANVTIETAGGDVVAGPSSTNSSGDFSTLEVEEGDYQLKATQSGNYVSKSISITVEPSTTKTKTMELKPLEDLLVNVHNLSTGNDAAGASVTLSGPNGTWTDETGWGSNAGKVKFYDRLIPGKTYTITTSAESVSFTAELQSDEEMEKSVDCCPES